MIKLKKNYVQQIENFNKSRDKSIQFLPLPRQEHLILPPPQCQAPVFLNTLFMHSPAVDLTQRALSKCYQELCPHCCQTIACTSVPPLLAGSPALWAASTRHSSQGTGTMCPSAHESWPSLSLVQPAPGNNIQYHQIELFTT
jgi:hypothetical protein